MYSNSASALVAGKKSLVLIVFFSCLSVESQAEDEFEFDVKPKRCITLHKGQTCYQRLKFIWRTDSVDEHCLYQSGVEQAVNCWTEDSKALFVTEFSAQSDVTYVIRKKKERSPMTQIKVEVNWVYQSSRKSTTGWRLF